MMGSCSLDRVYVSLFYRDSLESLEMCLRLLSVPNVMLGTVLLLRDLASGSDVMQMPARSSLFLRIVFIPFTIAPHCS